MSCLETSASRLLEISHRRSLEERERRVKGNMSVTCTWHLLMASLTLSTLISLKPLIFNRVRRVAEWTACSSSHPVNPHLGIMRATYSDRVIAIGLELPNVYSTDTVALNSIDIYNEAILCIISI